MKKVLAICGSNHPASSNRRIIQEFVALSVGKWDVTVFQQLDELPAFNPAVADAAVAPVVVKWREQIALADGVLISTPEYVFSLPGTLKNALEWTVSTRVFSGKPVALITAAALGTQAHASLRLIMKTIEAVHTDQTQVLINGVRGKFDGKGHITDAALRPQLVSLWEAFDQLIDLQKEGR